MQAVTKQEFREVVGHVYGRHPGVLAATLAATKGLPESFVLTGITKNLSVMAHRSVGPANPTTGELMRELLVAETINRFVPALNTAFVTDPELPDATEVLRETAFRLRAGANMRLRASEPSSFPLVLLPGLARKSQDSFATQDVSAAIVTNLCFELLPSHGDHNAEALSWLDVRYLQLVAQDSAREGKSAGHNRSSVIQRVLAGVPATALELPVEVPPSADPALADVMAEAFDDPSTELWKLYPAVRRTLRTANADLRDPMLNSGETQRRLGDVEPTEADGDVQRFVNAWTTGKVGRGRRSSRRVVRKRKEVQEIRFDLFLETAAVSNLGKDESTALSRLTDHLQQQDLLSHFVPREELEGAIVEWLSKVPADRASAWSAVQAVIAASDQESANTGERSLFDVTGSNRPGRSHFVRALVAGGFANQPQLVVLERALEADASGGRVGLGEEQMAWVADLIFARANRRPRQDPDVHTAIYLQDVMNLVDQPAGQGWSLERFIELTVLSGERRPTVSMNGLSAPAAQARLLVAAAQRRIALSVRSLCLSALNLVDTSGAEDIDNRVVRAAVSRDVHLRRLSKDTSARVQLRTFHDAFGNSFAGSPVASALDGTFENPDLLDFALFIAGTSDSTGVPDNSPAGKARVSVIRALASDGPEWGSKAMDAGTLLGNGELIDLMRKPIYAAHVREVFAAFGQEGLWSEVLVSGIAARGRQQTPTQLGKA